MFREAPIEPGAFLGQSYGQHLGTTVIVICSYEVTRALPIVRLQTTMLHRAEGHGNGIASQRFQDPWYPG